MDKESKIFGIVTISIIVVIILGMVIYKSSTKEETKTNNTGIWALDVKADFKKEDVLNSGYPALLDIGGAECIPCKSMRSVLEELNEEWQGKIVVNFVDYWKYPDLAKQFNFSSIPTQFFYDKDGKLYTTHVGAITKAEVIKIFKEMGYSFDE